MKLWLMVALFAYVATFATASTDRVVTGNFSVIANGAALGIQLANPSAYDQAVTIKILSIGDWGIYYGGTGQEITSTNPVICTTTTVVVGATICYKNCSLTETIPSKGNLAFSMHMGHINSTSILGGISYEITVSGNEAGYLLGTMFSATAIGAGSTPIAGGMPF